MTHTSIQNTKNKAARLYATCFVALIALVGTMTLMVLFVSSLNTN